MKKKAYILQSIDQGQTEIVCCVLAPSPQEAAYYLDSGAPLQHRFQHRSTVGMPQYTFTPGARTAEILGALGVEDRHLDRLFDPRKAADSYFLEEVPILF